MPLWLPEITTRQGQDKLLSAACEFQGRSLEARRLCQEKFRQVEPEQSNALRILIDGQIGMVANDVTKKVRATNPAISYQISVSASFHISLSMI